MAALAVVAGCGSEAPEFRRLEADNVYAMLIPAGTEMDEMTTAARSRCSGLATCQVMGWSKPGNVASGFPLEKRQVETLAFMYTLNKLDGFEQSEWDCSRFRRSDPSECLTEAHVRSVSTQGLRPR